MRSNTTSAKSEPPKGPAKTEEVEISGRQSGGAAPFMWTGPVASIMQRLDPRHRYLVTDEALQDLEEQQQHGAEEDGGGSDSDSDDCRSPMVSSLSSISLKVPHLVFELRFSSSSFGSEGFRATLDLTDTLSLGTFALRSLFL